MVACETYCEDVPLVTGVMLPLQPPEALQLVIPPSVVHLRVTGPLVARVVLSTVKEVMVGPQILVPMTGWPQFVVHRVSKQVLLGEQIPFGIHAGVPPPPELDELPPEEELEEEPPPELEELPPEELEEEPLPPPVSQVPLPCATS